MAYIQLLQEILAAEIVEQLPSYVMHVDNEVVFCCSRSPCMGLPMGQTLCVGRKEYDRGLQKGMKEIIEESRG